MESEFGALDAFAFVVFAVLIAVAVIIIVGLGQLPGKLASKWGHPQAAAINVASWLGIATGGVLWPLALIWAFLQPSSPASPSQNQDARRAPAADPHTKLDTPSPGSPRNGERRP
jgi:Protein of unknown function (DUF3302)